MKHSLLILVRDLLIMGLLVFSPIKSALVTVMILTIVDLLTGLTSAIRRKENITSSGLKRTIIKILAYELVIMLGFLTEQYLTGDLIPVVKVLAGLIGMTELKSIIENIQEITGVPLAKLLIKKLNQEEKDVS